MAIRFVLSGTRRIDWCLELGRKMEPTRSLDILRVVPSIGPVVPCHRVYSKIRSARGPGASHRLVAALARCTRGM
jgi:hypothetical protein